MYHVNTEFAYDEREDELGVLEATFFIDVAKPSTIDTVGMYYLLSFTLCQVFFSDFLFYLSGKLKTL